VAAVAVSGGSVGDMSDRRWLQLSLCDFVDGRNSVLARRGVMLCRWFGVQ